MYDIRPNLIIGFHGCDENTANHLVAHPNQLVFSKQNYDWLGHGFYFWENNYERALQWAMDKKKRGRIEKPAVVGAVINLGYCCDFIDSKFTGMIRDYYDLMLGVYNVTGVPVPENKDFHNDQYKDKIFRELDCTVIEFMHSQKLEKIQEDILKTSYSQKHLFDSVRGVFLEGGPAFDGAGISSKSHIQICVRNSNCIKGFFLPRKEIDFMKWLEKQ